MSQIALAGLSFLGLLCVVNSVGEKCIKNKDCHGYARFNGYRCSYRQCICSKKFACSSYVKTAQQENRYNCTKREDCLAYNEYSGVSCKNGACACIRHFACGGCLPRVEVLRMGSEVNKTCVFDMYGSPPFWTNLVTTDTDRLQQGDICQNLGWAVTKSVWRIYTISHVNNFEILEENFVSQQVVLGRWGNLDKLGSNPINGLYAMKLEATVVSSYGYNKRFDLVGYFAGSCAKSYEETGDPNYNTSHPYCDSVNQEVIHFGGNVSYNYSYELPECWNTSAVYSPAELHGATQGCSVKISCPSGCHALQNPQILAEFTVDIGCPYTIKQIELIPRNCLTLSEDSCVFSDVIRCTSIKSSVKYKPWVDHRKWNYHGLFVKVYLTSGSYITGHQIVEYGPIPVKGYCHLLPRTGYALITGYNLTCTGFSVTRGLQLRYTLKINHRNNWNTGTKIFWGYSPDRINMLLQQGQQSTDYTVYVLVKAAIYTGAHQILKVKVQVLPPPPDDEAGGVVGLAESFLTVDENKNSSVLQDLITQGNSKEATQLLGAITSSLNVEDEAEAPPTAGDTVAKAHVREGIMTALKEIPVSDIEDVSSTVDILNKATEVKEEISDEAQEAATNLYVNLADNLDSFTANQSASEVSEAAESLLEGVTHMLDVNIDTALQIEHIKLLAQTEVGAPGGGGSDIAKQDTEAVQKKKNSTMKLLNTVNKVSATLVDRQPIGAESFMYETESMTIGIQKLSKQSLATASYTASGASNSNSSFAFPDFSDDELPDGEQGVKMLYMDKNPYVWAAAGDITSPVMTVSLTANNTPVNVHNLHDPITVTLSSPGAAKSSLATLRATVVKNRINLENETTGNITLDDTRHNILTFNITAVSDRTISLSITSHSSITSFKMLIKTDSKPTLEEITEYGFLYPKNIPRWMFASFNLSTYTTDIDSDSDSTNDTLDIVPPSNSTYNDTEVFTNDTSEFAEVSDDYLRRLYITPDNPLSLGIVADYYTGNFSSNTTGNPLSLGNLTDYYAGNSSSNTTGNFSGVYYFGITLDLSDSETLLGLKENYPDCLGSDKIDCKEDVIVDLEIQSSQLGCFYWDEVEDSWSSQGCEVSPYSTNETIECLCTHLTAFSGSILVLPNTVDPFDFELFLTFFDNPVVVTAVIIVWVVYFFIIHWARQADKWDKEKVGVINCPDNNPSHNYVYLVCVVTGWWREAGTHANIFLFLKGSKGRSSNHCLTAARRPCFQSGNDDWFLITTEQSLGTLQSITLWHDNTGTRPHWYLNHVYVKDIQLRKAWHFIYNDWLAVDRGHMLQTSATVEAITQEEIFYRQKHNFMVKSTQDLRDGHLWLSIFSKPAKSTFTRVQRLTCALSLLLTTMLTNIMFYGIPTDNPEDQVAAGDVTFSLSAIIIGIESSLIMFPINLIILQLFLKSKPKPWSRTVKSLLDKDIHVKTVRDTSRRLTDMVMCSLLQRIVDKASSNSERDRNNNAEDAQLNRSISRMAKESLSSGKWSRGSETSRDQSASTLKSETSEKGAVPTPKNPKVLPWWFLYIAWFLVLSTSLISSYFVMLYGLKYGYDRSVSWLISFLTGFTQSAFVTQPLKVICIAVVITIIFKKPADFDDFGPDVELGFILSAFVTQPLKVICIAVVITIIFKKPADFDDFGPDVELDQDEVYLQEVEGADETHHPTMQPLSEYLLSKLRHRLYLEWLMDITLRDITLYIVYMVVVIFMVHSHRNVNLAYHNTVAIETLLTKPSCIEEDDCVSLDDATTVEGMFSYLEKVLVPLLTDMSESEHEYPTPGSNHFITGPLRLRQQRIKKGSCDSTSEAIFRRFNHDLPDCVPAYSSDIEDSGSYNNSWKNPILESSETGLWSYQSSWKLMTMPYAGNHATYGGGGFVLELSMDNETVNQLNDLKGTDWLDDRTRVVFVEFTLYNPNIDMFSVVMILVEFTNIGGIFPSLHIFTAKLDHYSSAMGTYILVCEILFLLFNIGFLYIEIKRYRKIGRKEYFKDKWSIADIMQMILAYIVIALFFQRLVAVNSALREFRTSNRATFISFYPAIVSDQILSYIMAFLVSCVIVKFLKLLRFNKKMFMISDTMALSRDMLFGFSIIFVLVMVAFGHFTTLAFGPFQSAYQSFGSSLQTLFQFAIDSTDLIDLQGMSHILGPLYFVGFILFTKWCLLQIFTVVLNFGISSSKAKTAMRKNKFEFLNYLLGKVKDAL